MSAAQPVDDWDLVFELAAALAELVEANHKAADFGRRLMAGETLELPPLVTMGEELQQLCAEARQVLAKFHEWAEEPAA